MTAREAPTRVLLVDDDGDILALLSAWLESAGYTVTSSQEPGEALARIEVDQPDLVVTDLVMDGMDGFEVLARIHQRNPLLPVVMLSGQAEIPDAIKAAHMGIAAFLVKPPKREDFLSEIEGILARAGKASWSKPEDFASGIVYRSAIMAELLEQAALVAQGDISVFITGRTGTGKELLARAIHQASPRAAEEFVGINCGAIPEQLLESELFGHEKGAFTGAQQRHEGLFKAADGGTLLLDEVGDMPLGLQVKLLRVLQDFEVRPVGALKGIPVNVRIISATHHDLAAQVEAGAFREDLFYRLNVVPLHMPALEERREDIPLLIESFLRDFADRSGQAPKQFAPEAAAYLAAAPWPGNIRQLGNVVEVCATLCRGEVIPLALAQRALNQAPAAIKPLKEARDAFDRDYLVSVLKMSQGNVAGAARIAGRNRTEFYKLLNAHGIDPDCYR